RVPDEHDRSAEGGDDVAHIGGVSREAAQRVGDGDGGDAVTLQACDDAVPGGGLGEGAVHEDDGGLLRGHGCLSFSLCEWGELCGEGLAEDVDGLFDRGRGGGGAAQRVEHHEV